MDNSRVFNNQLVLVDFDIELVGFPLPHGGDTFAVCGWETQAREKVSETKILSIFDDGAGKYQCVTWLVVVWVQRMLIGSDPVCERETNGVMGRSLYNSSNLFGCFYLDMQFACLWIGVQLLVYML
jgi:hypothetical protein